MLIWFWTKFFQTFKVFLGTCNIRTKFSRVFLHAYISLTKSHVYFGYNVLCTDDRVCNSIVRIFVRRLVTGILYVNGLVTGSKDVSNNNRWCIDKINIT